ncbi:MAG: 2-oxoglutarate dehydrogenase complex dihydrolipoyllysine-residue succinyltransferase [Rickettsiales bacterium]|nr:2-oxoglutarate dehydrogenase complex dihydrolipoyllysine-residue succinyltransferase [Pseudomonadota bacterium]MDA0966983.1 2-oxoglutarate dehydrogenase complex dihydrolipoyllysine-residue succinyltransferase [Pseudomonadota bacterium]MDG4543903.1 2-oxoglutarate dehydrogenase complex dihydrolipoyllysine-residue succinyltransferase [Rickettsiales bacterium]MDG4546049.1 2-oxoglutarate dehydrogenase complex dihydrolipoyllysine-residue succinyltransferase [Rickettsiales bacterium]MDG4548295.1 2-
MTIEIKVPPLGESVSEATIANWCKSEGDYVEQDEMLVELETDKVTLEVNAPSAGVLQAFKFAVGDTVKVGAVIGSIDEKAAKSGGGKKEDSKKEEAAPAKAAAPSSSGKSSAVLSPAAQKIATENNLNLSSGTGKDGRVTKADALNAVSTGGIGGVSPAPAGPREERVKMTKLRQKIAQRLKDSQNTAAILTTFNEVDMTNVMELRNTYKDDFLKKNDVKLGFMSFFAKAAIKALKEIPAVNAEIQGDEIIYKNHYDISIAVGTPQGLVVPVLRDADRLSFAGVEQEIVNLGKKARDGKLTMEDMTGGTFTISNGGVYGSLLSTPIINPPQTGILGLHKIQDRPMAIDGEVKIRPMMYIALSYDHRIIDGGEAVTFLVKIKEAIEDPRRLLLDI